MRFISGNRIKSKKRCIYSFFYRFAGHFLLFAFPAGTFQQAYGSSSQEKQPTEIRPAKTFHADKTLGKYLPVDHPGTAPDGRTDKAHPRPERHDTSREQHLPAVPARKYRIRYGETARFAPENRATEPGGGPAAPGLCFPYGVPVRSGYGTVYRNTSPEIPRRRNHPPSRRHHSNRCRPILSLNASAARTNVRAAP